MYPNNNNNNNNRKKRIKIIKGADCAEGRPERREKEIFFFFVSFLDLRKSDRRFSSGLKAKLIYAMRATRGHQNLGVSSNSMR